MPKRQEERRKALPSTKQGGPIITPAVYPVGTKRAVLYLRKSKDEQNSAHQRETLEKVAARAGWTIIHTFEDEGISGSRGREHRPDFDNMLRSATRREFDVLMVWAVDRISRSVADLVTTLNDLHASGIDLYIDQQTIDTTTPTGKAMYQMAGVFAEWERSMLISRVRSGLEHAKKHGTRSGKAIGRPRVGKTLVRDIEEALTHGTSTERASKTFGVSRASVSRILHGNHPYSSAGFKAKENTTDGRENDSSNAG